MEPQSPSQKAGMETRNRSRSRTPGLQLRVSVERDVNGDSKPDKLQKSPSVATIEEELNSSQKSTSGSGGARAVRKTRTVTSDYSSDGVSPERLATKEASFSETAKSMTVSKTTVSVTTSSSSTASSSTLTRVATSSNASPSKKEVRQNEINRTLEDTQKAILRTSTPKASSKVSKKVKLTPEELKQHVAYKEYTEAGEYWNKYPKTDYTYSELSPFRRELAPGMIAMPNMSRPGLYKHAERINVMIERNPTQASYIRQRYANTSTYSTAGVAGGSFAQADPYDSGEETLDLSQLSRTSRSYNRSKRSTTNVQVEEHRSMISRFFLTIVNWFYSTSHSVSRVFNQSDHNLYYTRIEDERGLFSRIYHFANMLVTSVFKKVYLLISSVLFLDTWLLQTSSSDVQQGRRKRKFLLLLLILLPFLLFGGIYLYLDPTPLQSLRENLANPLLNYDLKLDLPDTEAAKAFAWEKWDSARHFTEYYFDSMKLASQNTVEEIRKIWQENVNHLFN